MDVVARSTSAIVLIAGILLVIEVMRRCADGRIGVNPLAGIRTRLVMTDEETWRNAHQAAFPVIQRWCVAPLVLAVLAVAMPWNAPAAACILASTALLLTGVVRGSMRGIRAAKELLRERESRSARQ